MMQAFVMSRYGGPEVAAIQDVPVPVAGTEELLIRVRAAGLNPVDYKTRQGMLKLILPYRFPVVMGNELAGVVEAVGPGVAGFSVGDRVFARVGKQQMGALAEFAVVAAEFAAPMPESLDFPPAAGVPLAGLTALQALRDELQVGPGKRVIITAGAGGVGTFAIPLAKHLGAFVATTASSRGEDLVRRLGADLVIDYTKQRLADVASGYDCAFDLVGGATLAELFSVVKPGGKVVSIAGIPEPQTARKDLGRGAGLAAMFWLASVRTRLRAARHKVGYRFLLMHPSGADLRFLTPLFDSQQLKVVIDRTFPFAEIAAAMAYLEAGRAKGKVVVTMP